MAEMGIPLIQSIDSTVTDIKKALKYVDGGLGKDFEGLKKTISDEIDLAKQIGDNKNQ